MNRSLNLREDAGVKVTTLVDKGRNQRYVAILLEVNQSTVYRIVKRFSELESYCRTTGQGSKMSKDGRKG